MNEKVIMMTAPMIPPIRFFFLIVLFIDLTSKTIPPISKSKLITAKTIVRISEPATILTPFKIDQDHFIIRANHLLPLKYT